MAELMREVPEPRAVGQRRLLALDSGGVRGVLTLEVLVELERRLRSEHDRPDLVLADYFDYFAGTSTGAMIAAGLALGWSAAELRDLYESQLASILEPIPIWKWVVKAFRYRYPADAVTKQITDAYGSDTLFGDARMRSLLMCAMQNVSTDSPWPLSNNPRARYNDPDSPDCNTLIPLWQVIRASSAGPLAYPPERFALAGRNYVFIDGALTPYNNPALQLFVMATAPEYELGWAAGADQLLLVSVGTGLSPNENPALDSNDIGLIQLAKSSALSLLSGPSVQQDLVCRTIGHCVHGDRIDGEVGAMRAESDPARKLFTYVRYNATLNPAGMRELGLDHLADPDVVKGLRRITGLDNVPALQEVGQAVAAEVDLEHLRGFLAVTPGHGTVSSAP